MWSFPFANIFDYYADISTFLTKEVEFKDLDQSLSPVQSFGLQENSQTLVAMTGAVGMFWVEIKK